MKREYKLEQKAGEIAQVAIVESSAIGIPNDHIEPWVKDFAIGVAVATAKWADSHPAWVSVEDELPPQTTDWAKPKYFLGLTKEGGMHKMYRMADPTICKDFENEQLYLHVTHWMQITPPVKKGGEK